MTGNNKSSMQSEENKALNAENGGSKGSGDRQRNCAKKEGQHTCWTEKKIQQHLTCLFFSLMFIDHDCSCNVCISELMLPRSAWKELNICSILCPTRSSKTETKQSLNDTNLQDGVT